MMNNTSCKIKWSYFQNCLVTIYYLIKKLRTDETNNITFSVRKLVAYRIGRQ